MPSYVSKRRVQKGSGELEERERRLTRPGFPGEKHGISLKSGARYNYLGPGTNVPERLKRRDIPINDLDGYARAHDIAYYQNSQNLKSGKISRPEFLGEVKKADALFKEKARKSKDAPILGKISATAIGAKEVGEDLFLPTSVFSGGAIKQMKKKPDPAEKLKMLIEQKKKNGKGKIEISSKDIKNDEEEKEEQEGGFIPLAIGSAILSGLAGTALDKLINHFFGNKKGGCNACGKKKMTRDDKIDLLKSKVREDQLMRGIKMVLS